MNKELILNGKPMGKVIGYRQNRDLQRWDFLMEAGYYIGVDFSTIKSFTSCGDLEVIMYGLEYPGCEAVKDIAEAKWER